MPDYGLAPVVQPEDSKVDVDVIFVHGLNGGRTRTWTADRERCPEDTPFWPQWLKNDIPSARVWTYGYNSSAFADVSADNVDIHAETFLKALVDSGVGKRKGDGLSNIVFVGHSLGGIIIKLIMVKASQPGQQYSYIFENTSRVIFLGSPHRGSVWANRLYNLQRWMPSRQDNNFAKLLSAKSSSLLVDIGAQFNSCWEKRPVYTARETKKLHGISMIVKLEDAKTHCRGEEVTDFDRDHRSVAKPLSRDDVLYKYVVERIAPPQTMVYFIKGEIDRTVLLPATRRKEVRGIGIRAMKWLSAYFASEGLQPDTRRLLRWELLSETQDEDESVSSVTLCEGTTYTTTYDYYTGARIVIEIKEDFKVEWTIFTPMSLFYPGSHRGQLVFPKDFPFKPIKVRWESPIVSPYVNDYGNISTTGELENDWGPAPIHMDELMVNLAAILVYGPGFYGHVDAIQNAYKPWNWHMMSGSWNKMIPKSDSPFTETLPEDWVISVTNFFARNFNNDDEDSFEEPLTSIIPAQAEQSTVAIDACIDVLRADRKDKTLAELGDFKAAFGKIKTFGEWRREEKRCAEVLAFLAPGHPSG